MKKSHKLTNRSGACPNVVAGLKAWCPWCYANLTGRSRFVGHRYYRTSPHPYVPWEITQLKRPTPSETRSASASGCPESGFATSYPVLCQYLSDDSWEDGKPRETSALSFTLKDGLWQLAVNDKALKASLYTSGTSMKSCMALAEKAVAEGTGQWRAWKRGK